MKSRRTKNRKPANERRLIVRIIASVATLIILTLTMTFIFDNAIITNDIMMGQMSNSDESYLIMDYYNRIKSVSSTIYGLVSVFIVGTTIFNIYKFIRNKGEKTK